MHALRASPGIGLSLGLRMWIQNGSRNPDCMVVQFAVQEKKHFGPARLYRPCSPCIAVPASARPGSHLRLYAHVGVEYFRTCESACVVCIVCRRVAVAKHGEFAADTVISECRIVCVAMPHAQSLQADDVKFTAYNCALIHETVDHHLCHRLH